MPREAVPAPAPLSAVPRPHPAIKAATDRITKTYDVSLFIRFVEMIDMLLFHSGVAVAACAALCFVEHANLYKLCRLVACYYHLGYAFAVVDHEVGV